MKTNHYLPHSLFARRDYQIEELFRCEGVKGYGIYTILIEILSCEQFLCVPESEIGALARRMRVHAILLKRILSDYGLFTLENNLYYCSNLSVMRVSAGQMKANLHKAAEKYFAKSPAKYFDRSPAKLVVKSPENLDNDLEDNEVNSSPHAGPHISSLSDIFILNKNKKKKRDAHEENGINPDCMAMLDQLSADAQWVDDLWKTSQMNQIHLKQFPEVVEQFKRHIRVCGKEPDLPDLKSVKLYFTNYLSPDSRTGKKVREHLIATAPKPTAGDRGPDGSYLFEKIINGKRTFKGGIPLPDDAPPCPSVNAWWDQDRNYWID